MNSSEQIQKVFLICLHSERKPVDSDGSGSIKPFRRDGAGIRLRRKLCDSIQSEYIAQTGDQTGQQFRRQQRRRTAADINRGKGTGYFIPPDPGFLNNQVDVSLKVSFLSGERCKGAVTAFPSAEGDVNIQFHGFSLNKSDGRTSVTARLTTVILSVCRA